MEDKYHLDTLAIHAGYERDKQTRSVNEPIYQTTGYHYDSTEQAANLFELEEEGNIYSRLTNPTVRILEKRIAALEGGQEAVAFSSGMAAIAGVALALCREGDNIVSSSSLYGGTSTLFTHTLKKWGIETRFADSTDPDTFAGHIDNRTKMVYFETIGNPKNDVPEIEQIVKIAHQSQVAVVCDNTVTSAMLIRPIDFGVDVVVQSCTKIIDGRGSSVGGIVVESGNFNWARGRYPDMVEPDASYHGLKLCEKFGKVALSARLRIQTLRDIGGCMSPFNAYMFLHGLSTLHLRVPRHCENALELARFLEANKFVSYVNYPGLESDPHYMNAQKYLPKGQGAILGFGIKGGIEAGKKFINSVKLASHVTNLLDSRTMVVHPASTTHQQLSEQEKIDAGVLPDFIRVSVGTEHIDDILADFEQAIKASQS
ncbi:O-acetylhomoserine aminocarboxypropyltransferase/cysteine synthase family protein [Sedimentisphaera salicampi]|uniref:O-acetylhomoserine aminocarboxypropyltransferase/cysteine synthase family protein n=1 Tax=Sedimentisphaera salicampi TaxID=1941349 RepID=UPI000B9B9C8A|nr:aminotransferase class I/II-fold pyridoxal phosphate-dependent enzyme [Sedimentisphaera salicampi]OXU15240.1 Methionine gamma-lyase [Sedimentisphaera salicampi]